MKPRVKICCISSVEEAALAIKYGASALGLVSEMPSGPGVISEKLISKIAGAIPPGVSSFLLTSKQNVDEIIYQQKQAGVNTIQLCDSMTTQSHVQLKKLLPGISIVQVIHVTGEESVDEAVEASQNTDAILLDSGNQKLEIKELGGTGRLHDWKISKIIRDKINKPMFLAGGLNPSNISDAVRTVQPYGVDICSGVRTNGMLDEKKLSLFFNNLNTF